MSEPEDDREGAAGPPEPKIDVDAIVRKIRRDIQARRGSRAELPGYTYRFSAADEEADPRVGSGGSLLEPLPHVIHSPYLRYMNLHWQVDPHFPLASHRALIGPIVVGAKRLLRKLILGLFVPVFKGLEEFFSNVVNHANEMARRVDQNADRAARNDQVLWKELGSLGHRVFDLDRDTGRRLGELEKSMVERMDLLYQRLDQQILSLERRIGRLEDRQRGEQEQEEEPWTGSAH